MPALPAVPNALRCRLLLTIGGKINQGLRFFYQYSGGPPTSANLLTFGSLLSTSYSAEIAGFMTPDRVLTNIILEDLSSSTGAVGDTAVAIVGTAATPEVSADQCVVTSYEVTNRYRGGHPRSYRPAGNAASLASSQAWTSSFVNNLVTGVGTFISSIIGTTEGTTDITNHIAISYYLGFTPIENPLTGRYRNVPKLRTVPEVMQVQEILGRTYVGSLRKRRDKTS